MGKIKELLYKYYPKYFAKMKFCDFNHMLIDLGFRGLGIMNYENNSISGEKYLRDFLLSNYDIKILFDVGAHKGEYSRLFMADDAEYFCFEPNPISFKLLRENVDHFGNVKVYNLALSNEIKVGQIYDYSDNGGSFHSSIYEKVITELHGTDSSSYDTNFDTVDHFSESHGIDHIDLLKIDTEGSELQVLKGATKMIQDRRVEILHFEFNEMNIYSRSFIRDFAEILEEFNLYRLLPNGFLPVDYKYPHKYELFAFQNIVGFRKDIDLVNNS